MRLTKKQFVDTAERTVISDISGNLVINSGVLAGDDSSCENLEGIRSLRESVMFKCIKVRDNECSDEDLEVVRKWYKVMFSTPPTMEIVPGWERDGGKRSSATYDFDSIEKLNLKVVGQISDEWLSEQFKNLEEHVTSCFNSEILHNDERMKQWAECGRRALSKPVDIKSHRYTSKDYWTQLFYQNVSFPAEKLLESVMKQFYTEFHSRFRIISEHGLLKPRIQADDDQGTALFADIEDVWIGSFVQGNQIRQDLSPEEAAELESIFKKGFFTSLEFLNDVSMVSDYLTTILLLLDFDNHQMGQMVDGEVVIPIKYRIINHDDRIFPLAAVYASLVNRCCKRDREETQSLQDEMIKLFKLIYKDFPQ